MKRTFKFSIIIVLAFSANIMAQNPLINLPSISPDGKNIAFNFQGDIWTSTIEGENLKRITVHEAYDTNPMWSHDGASIAFESDRYGNNDIYVVSSKGGLPKRITFHSATDYLSDYTKNGTILFETRRDFAQVERENEIHKVNDTGGTPTRLMTSVGFDAKLSPNGKFIVFVKGNCRIARESYRGPANRNIWLYNIEKDTYTQLTTYDGNDFYPQWSNDSVIYFQSSQSGKYNIHKLNIDASGQKMGQIEAVTAFKDMGIFSFSLSANGKDLAMVKGDKLFISNTSSNSPKEVKLYIGSDYRFDPIEHKTFTNRIEDIALSPNGKRTAIVIRGELFVRSTEKDNKKTVNISKSAYRDRMPVWLSDSTLVFVSDSDGQNDLYLLTSDDTNEPDLLNTLKYKVLRLTETKESEQDPILSPDGKSIAYKRGRGEFIVAKIDANGKLSSQKLLLDGWATANDVSWSPDSKWLAYSLSDLDFNREVYIHKADNSQKPVNISMHPKQDAGPIWSDDGKKLVFSSNRNNGDYDVWFTWLNKADWEKTPQDWEDEKNKGEKKEKNKDTNDKADNSKDTVEDITIDFEDIYERQVQVTSFVGGEFGEFISKDGETIYYTTGNGSRGDAQVDSDLYKISWEGKDKKAITTKNARPSNITADKKGTKFLLTKGSGSLSVLNLVTDKSETLSITAKMDVDYFEESNQIFDEAWKAINDGFYDPDFHGQDWEALKTTFKPLAMKASTRRDFQNIFNWMLGQINASHMGFYVGENREDLQRERTGLLGIEVKPNANGSIEVTAVVANMPADKSASSVMVGDVITAVSGTKLTKNLNFYSLLEGTSNEKIYLEIKRGNNNLEVIIRPGSSNRYENYKAWVKERKRLTEKYSNGKLGYIHIQGMNWQSFENFERELTAAGLGKEGLVIDVRFNGGGWTTDYLMAVLNVKQHAFTVPRGAAKNLEKDKLKFVDHYPFSERLPLASWTKPSIALCNSTSYSNAEIFSHAYKALGLGTLVGEPTFGAVISTGAARLIDGSRVRMPFRGWYVKESTANMELGPAVPDILIKNNPDDKSKGQDTQLKKAVETLLKQL
ncbi:C-terminal processing protease CtpA/Prc, contains a PDZ domain [Formosa sp. Hel1_31_208]|uniref:S41 family peptidase n=1 Tax=Formosa sp. Hel1_31_208 TaxID=1798225 RepID=UPI00087A1B7E|nr:S41 family peptidase [Formosa sp. Hel1_31_208]SDS49493.1 C-terminal processing protease CtpA/Prc, contains a PDZ domain [Formosa sp. Hel1_31_208]